MMRVLIAAAVVALAVPAAAQQVRSVPPGTQIEWNRERDGDSARYRSGDVALVIRARVDGDDPELATPLLTVEIPGYAPVTVEGALTWATFPHRVAVGRWDSQRPYVLFQSFTGGAHCCNVIQAAIVRPDRIDAVDLGTWDGDYLGAMPRDVDGDGTVDFVFRDDAFLYAFAPYAMSYSPPLVFDIAGDKSIDLSSRPAFRPIFAKAARQARKACVSQHANGACAAYVAAAARAGRFMPAWNDMLKAYDRRDDWELPSGCRVPAPATGCPEDQQIRYAGFPDALRAFLAERNYPVR
jgi:hypothetical protein